MPFVKYRGHVINADMKDDLGIMRPSRQLYAQGNALARRFHNYLLGQCESRPNSCPLYYTSLNTSQLWWK